MSRYGFLFSLPLSFLDSAEPFSSSSQLASDGDDRAEPIASDDAIKATQQQQSASAEHAGGWNESGATCIACGIGVNSQGFSTSAEQRQHFKTDWHRYNVKRRLERKPPVTEDEFDRMIEAGDDVSSISGSDTDSSDEEDDSDTADPSSIKHTQAQAAIQGAQVVFRTSEGGGFAVWRCLLLPDSHKHRQAEPSAEQLLHMLRQLRQSPDNNGTAPGQQQHGQQQVDTMGCIWVLMMLRGGHFAAAVVKINSSSSSSSRAGHAGSSSSSSAAGQGQRAGSSNQQQEPQQQQPQQQQQRSNVHQAGPAMEPFTVLAHKTFHRYVVRAKAGGKQSSKDATGKYARSAGSRLRRYNEAALQRDITQLLKDWAPYLQAAQLIFLAAPGSNSKVLFAAAADVGPLGAAAAAAGGGGFIARPGGGGLNPAVLDSGDSRVRRVPFVTQRPTFSELKRVLVVLGSVRHVDLPSQSEVAAAAAAAVAQDEGVQEQQKQQKKQETHMQVVEEDGVGVAAVSPVGQAKKQEEPPLLKASKAGDAERVSRLLANGHDPTVRDSRGRSPYQLAANKEVRDAFRRFMADQPDAWDYSSSDIPSPLTQEMETAQQSKKAEKRARQKAKEKDHKDVKAAAGAGSSTAAGTADTFDDELAAAMAEAAAISNRAAASGKAKQVGPASSSSSRGRGRPGSTPAAAAAGPSPEDVARRREQLAAAAEARLKALQQKQQLWSG